MICRSQLTAGDLGIGVLGQARVEDGIRHLVSDLVCQCTTAG